jgi:6-phosphogluconolactonase
MPPPSAMLVFVSMFAADPAGGIQAFHLDPAAGTLTPAATTPAGANSFLLALAPDATVVYALTAGTFGAAATEEVTAWRIADRDGTLEPCGRRPAGGAATCFVAPVGAARTLLLAHYSGATLATLPLGADGGLAGDPVVIPSGCPGAGVVADRQEASHPHAIIAAPRAAGQPQFVSAADLGCDAILGYRLDPASGRLAADAAATTRTPPGAGPRHLTFHPDGRRLYVINELANTVGVYDFDAATGRLTERQIISTLPADGAERSFTADVRVTPDGRFLYGTNRGHDSIACYAIAADGTLSLVEIVPSRGRGPQNIAITPDGTLLVCANMPGNSLSVFRIERATGRLTPVGDPLAVASPSSIAIVPQAGAGR